jgi:hypothetical protein
MRNHTFPGHSKGNKSLTVSEYTELLGLAAEARKMIGAKYERLQVGKYRAFTEARKGGLRTKLWGSGFVKPQQVKDIQDMLTKRFPQLNIKVRFDGEHRWFLNSLSIFMQVKPNSTVAKPAVVAEKPKARLTGTPMIMQSAVIDVATIPAGKIGLESQFHIHIGKDNQLEFELVDTWLVLNDNLVKYNESEKYNNYLEMHLGRSIEDIRKDAMNAAEELVRQSVVFHGKRLFVG